MNKEQINRIIQDNELFHGMMALGVVMDANHLEKFAKLVAAEEREACAKEINAEINDEIEDEAYCILVTLLARIRARGQG
jgi:hypothetical protein